MRPLVVFHLHRLFTPYFRVKTLDVSVKERKVLLKKEKLVLALLLLSKQIRSVRVEQPFLQCQISNAIKPCLSSAVSLVVAYSLESERAYVRVYGLRHTNRVVQLNVRDRRFVLFSFGCNGYTNTRASSQSSPSRTMKIPPVFFLLVILTGDFSVLCTRRKASTKRRHRVKRASSTRPGNSDWSTLDGSANPSSTVHRSDSAETDREVTRKSLAYRHLVTSARNCRAPRVKREGSSSP